ncbi:hypothetical protein [Terribacillus saccharophilus]|uniref:hypothetical protein n=1 Tax=Terribacillus saccharophilus TaxID=361277 RepID=UPI000B81A72E|nr:hypothetical protein [Terribacillus saccharophilus]MCM3225700.1 hypothetical protein [Terribacillus saccharophilus]MEC0281589.1 hypothetical protein [Terribacillus saccharophilus]MEC0291625.1 hypothetical protein [Terribacillus saccharophilus]
MISIIVISAQYIIDGDFCFLRFVFLIGAVIRDRYRFRRSDMVRGRVVGDGRITYFLNKGINIFK